MLTYQTQLDWLIKMSNNPGFKAHAWHQAQQLDDLFPGIANDLVTRMTGMADSTGLESLQKLKRRLAGKK
jgi:hypothetical protein